MRYQPAARMKLHTGHNPPQTEPTRKIKRIKRKIKALENTIMRQEDTLYRGKHSGGVKDT
jgi:hypothetical protein